MAGRALQKKENRRLVYRHSTSAVRGLNKFVEAGATRPPLPAQLKPPPPDKSQRFGPAMTNSSTNDEN